MGSNIEKYLVAEERELIEWSLMGDNAAFDALAMRFRDQLRSYLRSRMGSNGNDQDIDDLMQDSFVKAFVHLGRYDPKYAFGQWIYTIARNTLSDFNRRRHGDMSLDERFTSSPEERSPNPEQKIINSQTRNHIESCIAKLSERHQELFRMRFIEEYSYEEIAEKLKMPMGSVKTNIHRARTHIIRLLQG